MARIYKLSRTGLRLIYKVRHHRGHGIHSPFVYNLVRKVIEEKTTYYAYNDIKAYIVQNLNTRFKPDKINKLSFRLVNYFNAKNILEIGSGKGINTLYLTTAASDIICHCVESDPGKCDKAKELYDGWNRQISLDTEMISLKSLSVKQDCIYINLKNYKNLTDNELMDILQLTHEKSFIIIEGIRTNKRCWTLWKRVSNIDSRTIALDLFNIGIVFFDEKLYPWKYKLSF